MSLAQPESEVRHVRVLQCFTCKTMQVLPDYDPNADPQYDVVLHDVDMDHGGQEERAERQHIRALHRVQEALWDQPRVKRQIVKQMWEGTTGFAPSYYDAQDTLREDALQCWTGHRRPGLATHLCSDYRSDSKRIGNPARKERQILARDLRDDNLIHQGPKVYLCQFCLTFDTEVVTREGIKRIEDLVGKQHELLIPVGTRWQGSTSARGVFQRVEVEFLGAQHVYPITLRRGKSERVIRATAEHRWFVWQRTGVEERTTVELRPGDALQPIKATPPRGKEKVVPFGLAQGFVFGDGCAGRNDHRPATVVLYGAKDRALLPYFVGCERQMVTANGKPEIMVKGLPRHWKQRPPIDESRSFLLSWLAGYFAADGSVSDAGQAVLYSADRENLEFVRSVAAICGVGTTFIACKERAGIDDKWTPLYSIGLSARELPDWFWVHSHHAERVAVLHKTTPRERAWKVVSVGERSSFPQEVFCARVPDVGAFALADDLLTGNCPYESDVQHMKADKFGDFSEKLN